MYLSPKERAAGVLPAGDSAASQVPSKACNFVQISKGVALETNPPRLHLFSGEQKVECPVSRAVSRVLMGRGASKARGTFVFKCQENGKECEK